MSSKWKGFFVDPAFYNKKEKLRSVRSLETQELSRRSVIPEHVVGARLRVHLGRRWQFLRIKIGHVGFKLGQLAYRTRVRALHLSKKKKQKKRK